MNELDETRKAFREHTIEWMVEQGIIDEGEAQALLDRQPKLHECEECGINLTYAEWPKGESCPICHPYYETGWEV